MSAGQSTCYSCGKTLSYRECPACNASGKIPVGTCEHGKDSEHSVNCKHGQYSSHYYCDHNSKGVQHD